MKQIKKQHDFIESRRLQVLKAETERVFALCFTKGSRRDGMRKLRVPLRSQFIYFFSSFFSLLLLFIMSLLLFILFLFFYLAIN